MDKISFYRWIVWWSWLARLLLHRPHCLRHLCLHHAQLTSFLQGIYCKKNGHVGKVFGKKHSWLCHSNLPAILTSATLGDTTQIEWFFFCVLLTKVNRCTKYRSFLCQSIFCWILRLPKIVLFLYKWWYSYNLGLTSSVVVYSIMLHILQSLLSLCLSYKFAKLFNLSYFWLIAPLKQINSTEQVFLTLGRGHVKNLLQSKN